VKRKMGEEFACFVNFVLHVLITLYQARYIVRGRTVTAGWQIYARELK